MLRYEIEIKRSSATGGERLNKLSLRSQVSTESRYGTNSFFFFFPGTSISDPFSAKAEITFPKVVNDLFIFAPSFSRVPDAPVEFALFNWFFRLCTYYIPMTSS